MKSSEFAEFALKKFTEKITDQLFLFIQEDEQLLQEYLDTISEHGRHSVNLTIGNRVVSFFGLKNMKDPATHKDLTGEPKSFLIKTEYTKHEK